MAPVPRVSPSANFGCNFGAQPDAAMRIDGRMRRSMARATLVDKRKDSLLLIRHEHQVELLDPRASLAVFDLGTFHKAAELLKMS
jgi:hypothetical protein